MMSSSDVLGVIFVTGANCGKSNSHLVEAYARILDHAKELRWKDYRGKLTNWQREYDELMKRKPVPPEDFDETVD